MAGRGTDERFDHGRVSAALDRRNLVWCLNCLVCRRMSDAVEGAEVILYGVSKGYKESANCRLEANYGHQQG